jgi:hypothetical protein
MSIQSYAERAELTHRESVKHRRKRENKKYDERRNVKHADWDGGLEVEKVFGAGSPGRGE